MVDSEPKVVVRLCRPDLTDPKVRAKLLRNLEEMERSLEALDRVRYVTAETLRMEFGI